MSCISKVTIQLRGIQCMLSYPRPNSESGSGRCLKLRSFHNLHDRPFDLLHLPALPPHHQAREQTHSTSKADESARRPARSSDAVIPPHHAREHCLE